MPVLGRSKAGISLIFNARGADALKAVPTELAMMTHVTAVPGDTAQTSHRHALAIAAQASGELDAVINNDGILGPSPLDVLADVYRINIIAPLAILQAVRPSPNPQARLINVSSDAAVEAKVE